MGPWVFFYVYMGNQRAKASSGWHLRACGKRDDLTISSIPLFFHYGGSLACFFGGLTDCWPYSYNIKIEREPVSVLVPLATHTVPVTYRFP
jgi:hypothetical protein